MSLKILEKTSNIYNVGPASTVLYRASGLNQFILIKILIDYLLSNKYQ